MNIKKFGRRGLSLLLALLMVASMLPNTLFMQSSAAVPTKKIYFDPGCWNVDGAKFHAWVWGGSVSGGGAWYVASGSGNSYSITIPADATGMKWLRKDPNNASQGWHCWNQTGDLTIGTNNKCTITDWGSAKMSLVKDTYSVSYSGTGLTAGSGTATAGADYSVTLSAQAGYKLPSSVTVTVGGTTLTGTTHYTYSSGKVTVKAQYVTGNIVITANCSASSYTVKHTVTGLTYSGGSTANFGTNYVTTLTAQAGYVIPDSVTVKIGGTTTSNYTYSNGTVTIAGSAITGNIEIIAEGMQSVCTVTYNGSNYTKPANVSAEIGKDYTATLIADFGYDLPKTITVQVGGATISGYTYDPATGAVTIPGNLITGNIVITVQPTKKVYTYNVSFSGGQHVTSDGADKATTDKAYTAKLTVTVGYVMPANIEIKVDGKVLTGGYTYNSATGELSIDADSLTGDVEITAITNELCQYSVAYILTGILNKDEDRICTHGQPFTATLTLADGYTTPVAIEVVANGKILDEKAGEFTYDNKTGKLEIIGEAVTGDIVITASGTLKTFLVTFNLTDLTKQSGEESCTYSKAYTATLSADAGFQLPESIEVMVNGKVLTEGYTYKNGVVTIDAAYVTGEILISGVADLKKCTVTVTGDHVAHPSGLQVTIGQNYQVTLQADSGYILPSTITVKSGNTTLAAGDYSYNSSTGVVSIRGTAITDDIVISVDITSKYVFLDPGPWDVDGAVFVVHYWYSDSNFGDELMKLNSVDGIYYVEIPADIVNLLFFRKPNPTGDIFWNQSVDLVFPNDGKNLYTVTGWGDGYHCDGAWSAYNGTIVPSGPSNPDLEEKDTFYVNTDMVDYLNDFRINSSEVNIYSADNQGIWMQGDNVSVFSYLNYIISSNAVDENGESQYSYPLYFGNLLFHNNRYGVPYKEFPVGDENSYKNYGDSNKHALQNWNSGANVALNNNGDWSAVVQGLVGKELDEHGQLVDPVTGKQLFYFDKTSIESWTTSLTGGKRLMAYYSNLQFPFKTIYDPSSRVTTYSYNSVTDEAVFVDYDRYDPNANANPMYSNPNYVKDQYNNKGFFPLNEPGDSGNESNYGFGVKFVIDFTVSDDGTIVSADGSETPVQFSFTGDDDVWVFIDGQLVLDMGGAHKLASGTIDFQSLTATVAHAAQVGDPTGKPSAFTQGGEDRGDQKVEASKTTAFPEALAKKFQNEYNTGVSQVHTLTMFYIERAGIESNMSIQFSMSPIPTGLTVSKDIDHVNPGLNDDVQDDDDFSFSIEAVDQNGNKVVFDGYDLTDHGNITTEGKINGNIITGIRGDQYAHNFSMGDLDAFTAGTKFVITEIGYDKAKYPTTRWMLYEYSNGYQLIAEGNTAEAIFEMLEGASGNYALNFINSLETGDLTISKTFQDTLTDTSNMKFTFEVYLDVHGEGYSLHPGLTYDLYEGDTLISEKLISEDGKISLKSGQSVKIQGIPVGTNYKVVELDNSPVWEVYGSDTVIGEMKADGIQLHFVNRTTANYLDKEIFVEAGRETLYAISNGKQVISLNSVVSNNPELTAVIKDGKIAVISAKAGQKYTFAYTGTDSDGVYISGTVAVYTFAATHKTYVFDFGLSADLAATTGDGLFQGGYFFNDHVSGTAAMLNAVIGDGNYQTAISGQAGAWIYKDGSSAQLIFRPVAFMSRVEKYSYTVQIIAPGASFDPNDPETGCTVTGTIAVMPANSVYYEDNFNVSGNDSTQKVVFGGGAVGQEKAPVMMQSNQQSGNYGYDGCYNGGYQYSGGNAVTLNNMEYAYFTFAGNGFDLISRTAADSAGLVVYVFAGGHKESYIDYLTNFNSTEVPTEMVFVNNYYNNGDLYQVPVVSVRLGGSAQTYTVYVQCLATATASAVQLDGVRIYNPMDDTGDYPVISEQNVNINELRVLYKNGFLSLAGNSPTLGIFTGTGKGNVIESMTNGKYATAGDLQSIYVHGPNNEMYLPENFGVRLRYTVTAKEIFTLQIGAKAIGSAKSVGVYVRVKNSGSYVKVGTVNIASATDMYYDLTAMLSGYDHVDSTYDLVLISESPDSTSQFVSLTTVKHSGLSLTS